MNNQNIINEIRSKIDIVDLIGEYIPLVQKGRNYFGVCPFHNDTNPSMSVSREKQIYKCFSCGASGNVFNFVSNYENMSFKEALDFLGKRLGYDLGNSKSKRVTNYDKYYNMYDLANKFYQNNLNTSKGRLAKEYLSKRSIDESIIKEFGIGLSLDDHSLLTLMTKKGYSTKELVDLGLIVDNHDIYYNRIMFPLDDINGNIVGFSGRIYDNSKSNKYVNTKETVIFKKGQCLYNYVKAKEASRIMKYSIVMEGFMDVIRANSVGFKNTVALMGTALTNEQVSLIKKLSQNIILCFDGDNAGYNATLSVGNELEKAGINPRVIVLTNDDDPDTYILKNGKDKFQILVDNAINFTDFKLNTLKKGVNFNSDIELSNYIDRVIKETSLINDEIRREIILKKLAIETNIGYNTLEKRLGEYITKKQEKQIVVEHKNKNKLSKYEKTVYSLIYLMINNYEVIDKYNKLNINLAVPVDRNLANAISYYYEKFGTTNIADLYTYLSDKEELLDLLNKIMSMDDCDNISIYAVDDYIQVIKKYNEGQEIKRLNNLMKNEIDPMEKARIADKIRFIKIGE